MSDHDHDHGSGSGDGDMDMSGHDMSGMEMPVSKISLVDLS